MAKRQVQVFAAGCPVCEPAVQLVNELSCPDCDVTIYNLNESGAEEAERYGIRGVPAVVVDGRIVSCCDNRGPNREELRTGGIGKPINA